MGDFCTNCGAPLSENMMFCTNCGKMISDDAADEVEQHNNINTTVEQENVTDAARSLGQQVTWEGDPTVNFWNSFSTNSVNKQVQSYNQSEQSFHQPEQSYSQQDKFFSQSVQSNNEVTPINIQSSQMDAPTTDKAAYDTSTVSLFDNININARPLANNFPPKQEEKQPIVQPVLQQVITPTNDSVANQNQNDLDSNQYLGYAKKTMTFGILGCALFWTVAGGIVFGILALKSSKKFNSNSIGLTNEKNKIGKILGIVGMALSAVVVIVIAII